MSQKDLTGFFREWPHRAGGSNARRLTGDDGRVKIQMRIDPIGVLHMEVDGRPDGTRPEGFESLLEYQIDRLERYTRESQSSAGFVVTPEECRSLREEAVLYYHRYVALFALGDYDNVVRDATRNLRVFEFCRNYASTDQDRAVLALVRPHVIRMRARAAAESGLAERDPRRALAAIDRGLDEIRASLDDIGRGAAYDQTNEVQLLRGMRDALVPKLPASQRVELEERLRAALDSENYELAAILRDELRLLE